MKIIFLVFLVLISFQSLYSQTDSIINTHVTYPKIGITAGLSVGDFNSKDVSSFVESEIMAKDWQEEGNMKKDGTLGFSIGLTYEFIKRLKVGFDGEVSFTNSSSHSKEKNPWGGFVGDDKKYNFEKWISYITLDYENYMLSNLTYNIGFGGGFNYLNFSSWTIANDAFATSKNNITIASGKTFGYRGFAGLSYYVLNGLAIEGDFNYDNSIPIKSNNLNLSYKSLGVGIKIKFKI